MEIRKAREKDLPSITALAEKFDLDHRNMRADKFWIAEENGLIIGIGQVIMHKDCTEIASVGVLPEFQKKGIGSAIVKKLLEGLSGEIYLATIKPKYFERFGFKKTLQIPPSMLKKEEWCEGCQKELCNVMVLKK